MSNDALIARLAAQANRRSRTRERSTVGQSTTDRSSSRYSGRSRNYNNAKFVSDIEDFVAISEKRMLALMRQSVADVIDNAQTAAAKGGRMRVDTGFLRASGQLSLNGMPSGPERGELTEPNSYSYDTDVIAELANVKLGSVIYFGWTASYARYRELYDGFLEGALQHWDRIVTFNTETIRERIKK